MSKERPWEKLLGSNATERTQLLGRTIKEFREFAGLGQRSFDAQWSRYLSDTGAQIMQTRISRAKEEELEQIALKKKQKKLGLILRKKISVLELDGGDLSVIVDREWDTADWSNEMIEAGCEALQSIFYDKDVDLERKKRASFLLKTLVFRHAAAEKVIRRSLESMIGKVCNTAIIDGKTQGSHDMFYILHAIREKVTNEMSNFQVAMRLMKTFLVEARSAAILIQTLYRAKSEMYKLRRYMLKKKISIRKSQDAINSQAFANAAELVQRLKGGPTSAEHFASDEEVYLLRKDMIDRRIHDIYHRWHLLHKSLSKQDWKRPIGLRGPIHIYPEYQILALDMIKNLVSPEIGELCSGNREDLVSSFGLIVLAQYLACPDTDNAETVVYILAHACKVPSSLYYFIHSGCLRACVKYYKYAIKKQINFLKKRAQDVEVEALMENPLERRKIQAAMKKVGDNNRYNVLYCIQIFTKLGMHAAGIFRARGGYSFKREAVADEERVNYQDVLFLTEGKLLSTDVLKLLGDPIVVRAVFEHFMETSHLNYTRSLLLCILSLSCSECNVTVWKEVIALGGRAMLKLISLLEEQDSMVNSLSLSIFLQICTIGLGRDDLIKANIPKYIAPLTAASSNYHRTPYMRSILVACSLCRVEDRRAYNPDDCYKQITNVVSLHRAILKDLLVTVKCPMPDEIEKMTIADLTVLPMDPTASLECSKIAESVGVRDIANYLCRPGMDSYFSSLPWDESAGCCCILEALTSHPGSAENVFSPGVFFFLCQCIFLCKVMLEGPSLSSKQLCIIFAGTSSAALAMSYLCLTGLTHELNGPEIVDAVKKGAVWNSICFLLNAMTIEHKAKPELIEYQHYVSKCILRFLRNYSSLLFHLDSSNQNPDLLELLAVGKSVSDAIRFLRNSYSDDDAQQRSLMADMDDLMQFCCQLTEIKAGADAACIEWGLVDSLRVHLPHPLSGVGDLGVEEERYKIGLGLLPPSYFELCAQISKNSEGKIRLLLDGFLRRSLDKLTLLHRTLNSQNYFFTWKSTSAGNEMDSYEPSVLRRDIAACLKFIAKLANFHHSRAGSANDLIFHNFYQIVEICRSLISWNAADATRSNFSRKFLNKDVAVLAAIECLKELSVDNLRVIPFFEESDVISLIREQLNSANDLPHISITNYIDTLLNIALAMYKSNYHNKVFPTVVPVLTKLSRLNPKYAPTVQETIYRLNRSITKVRAEFDEVRSGVRDSFSFRNSYSDNADDQATVEEKHFEWGGYGTYEQCGPTSCGGLRFSDSLHSHGEYTNVSIEEKNSMLLSLPVAADGVMDVSKLSARESDLRETLHLRKYKDQFVSHSPTMKSQKSYTGSIASASSEEDSLQSYPSSVQFPSPMKSPLSKKSYTGFNTNSNPNISPLVSKKTVKGNTSSQKQSFMKTIEIDDLPELILTKPPPAITLLKPNKKKNSTMF